MDLAGQTAWHEHNPQTHMCDTRENDSAKSQQDYNLVQAIRDSTVYIQYYYCSYRTCSRITGSILNDCTEATCKKNNCDMLFKYRVLPKTRWECTKPKSHFLYSYTRVEVEGGRDSQIIPLISTFTGNKWNIGRPSLPRR